MKIVTGYTGTPHVTSNAVQGFNQGIFGGGNCVLGVGNKFEAELTNVNTVTISDGEGIMQGVHFRIDPGTNETVNISNGTTGYQRIDYICARYEKNTITGAESVSLVVVEGTPAADTPVAPVVNTGDILLGGTPVDFPLYKVELDGLTPTISSMFEVVGAFSRIGTVQEAHYTSPTEKNAQGQYIKLASVNLEKGTYILLGWAYFSTVPADAYYGVRVGSSGGTREGSTEIKNGSTAATDVDLACSWIVSVPQILAPQENGIYAKNGDITTTIHGGITAIKIADFEI